MTKVAACALVATTAIAVLPLRVDPIDAAGGAPACSFRNSSLRRCNRITAPGARGAVGLIGDSVLLGSADGFWGSSYAGLPTALAGRDYGPISYVASQGMTTFGKQGGLYWVDWWKANKFDPSLIVVNLGANHLGECSPADITRCSARINTLLDAIASAFPTAIVWWAKTNHETYGRGTGYSPGMLGWNLALDAAAAARTNLVVWDWPTALRTASPPIATDGSAVHPSSGVEYAKRTALMVADIVATTSSTHSGSGAALPAPSGDPLSFRVMPATAVYETTASGAAPLDAGVERVIDLSALPTDTRAVALGVTGWNATGGGFLTLYRCGDPRPSTSNLNVQVGVTRAAQALVQVTDDLQLCAWSNVGLDLSLMIEGVFTTTTGDGFTPITPIRAGDTRNADRSLKLTAPVPHSHAVAVSLTIIGGARAGTATLFPCDASIPTTAHLPFRAGEVVAVAAIVPVSGADTVCVFADTGSVLTADAPHIVLDVTGTFDTGGLRYQPVPATRLLDTRDGTGGWTGRPRRAQTLDVVAAPTGAGAVSGTVTLIQPLGGGHVRGYACGAALPPTSAVNAQRGLVAANTITSAVSASTGSLCLWTSTHAHLLFDVVGWWVS